MGKIIIATGGGGGVSSDELTVDANNVVKGYTYVGVDTDDEIGTGTLELTGNATNPYVLEGNTYYSTDPHTKNTGTMVDRRVIDSTLGGINSNYPTIAIHKGTNLQIGNTVTSNEKLLAIQAPTGYYDGSYVGTLASNLGDATAAYVYNGKYFTSSAGLKVKGTMTVSSVLSFSVAAYSTTQLLCTWKNPAQASGRPFSGVIICCKTGSYPTSPTDGYKYMGSGGNSTAQGTGSATISGLTAGTTYYLRIWSYCVCSAGNYTVNSTKVLTNGYLSATCATTASGRKAFTSSGTWTVPSGVRTINVTAVGGGGSGHSGKTSTSQKYAGGGGGGGGITYQTDISVEHGNVVTFTIGAGGTNLTPTSTSKEKTGGNTTVSINNTATTSLTASGGCTAYSSTGTGGSAGNSNGGTGGRGANIEGGSDAATAGRNGGYEFGDSTKTRYSGGGGGGGLYYYYDEDEYNLDPANGGNRGGGKGATYSRSATAVAGTAGTGGGGGGGCFSQWDYDCAFGAYGGCGCVVITW